MNASCCLLVLLLIFNYCRSDLSDLLPIVGSDGALVGATNSVIKEYFMKTTSAVNFVVSTSSRESDFVSRELIDRIVGESNGSISVRIENYFSILRAIERRTWNIFFVDNFESTAHILNVMALPTFRFDGYYLIVLILPSKSIYSDVHKILVACWKNYLVNVNIITYKLDMLNAAFMYSYFPFTQHFCGKVYPVIVNEFQNNRFLRGHDHYPQKMKNLYKCPLQVALFEFPPYILISKQKSRKVAGTDGMILTELSRQMNFTIDVKFVTSKHLWGQVMENGTSTGAIKMITDRKVHFAIGFYMSSINRNKIMKSSYTYTVANLIWVVPPGRSFTAFEKLFKPFGFYTWTAIVVIFVFSLLVVMILRFSSKRTRDFVYGKDNRVVVVNIVNICLGGPSLREPGRNFARTLLMIFLLYCLVIRSGYQSGLFKFLQMDTHDDHADSFVEMLELNYDFYVVEAVLEQIANIPALMKRKTVLEIPAFNKLLFHALDENFNGAFLVAENHAALYNRILAPTHQFVFCRERISSANLVIYYPKKSYLNRHIDSLILYFQANGLINYFNNIYVDSKYLKKRTYEHEPTKLSVSQLVGGFQVCFIGICFAVFVFLLEILSIKIEILRDLLEFFN